MSKENEFGEPWAYRESAYCTEVKTSKQVGIMGETPTDTWIPDVPQMKRIIECVNVCAGWDIEQVKNALLDYYMGGRA